MRVLSRAAVLVFVLVTTTVSVTAAEGQVEGAFSLDQILSAPFPSSLVAAPRGGHVAWVFNDRGARNLWIASPPEYRGRAITHYTEDDGQEITSVVFEPNNQRIAYVYGGAANSRGELPNPTSDPGGANREVRWVDLARGQEQGKKQQPEPAESHRVASGSAPLFLDDGRLLFVDQGTVKVAVLPKTTSSRARRKRKTVDAPKIQDLIQARGSISNLRLSPDGQRLALVSGRGSHSFVGVYSLTDDSLRFLAPSLDSDGSPVWSPDSRQIAFLRTPARAARTIFEPRREGQPWSIHAVHVDSGESREIFRAEPGRGSVYRGVVGRDQLFWTTSQRLVFPWEKDGWTHLYSVSTSAAATSSRTNGNEPRLLTPGDFEVEYVERSTDGAGVIFSSNQGDIDRRHLWRVAADAVAPMALTSGDGIENVPVPVPGSDALAFLHAGGRRPLVPAIQLASGEVRYLAREALDAFPARGLVEPKPVIFAAADGMMIHGQLFEPPARYSGRRPALLFFHGGSRRHMMLGFHYSSYYHNCYAFNQYMAAKGYVVMSVNYRSGIGYGLDFREALDYGATGASELNDVLGAGLYLRSRDDVDPDRIGLWGGSYGGYLTALGLARASHLFAAGVDIHGVHDWNQTIQNFLPSYNPLEDPARARLAFESSPLSSLDTWRSPVLLIHGDDDRNVPFKESVDLVEQLRARGVEHEVLVFPDEVHGFLRHESWLRVFQHSERFFDKHLGAAAVSERKVAALQ